MQEISMHLIHRIYQGERDLASMAALVRLQPADNLHVVDLPYRLSSWAFEAAENCALWENRAGELLAWAVLQSPFWAIDYAIHPAAPATMHQRILAWADQRARAIQGTPFGRPSWFANVFDRQRQRQQELERAGFASQADVGDNSWSKVLFIRSSDALPPRIPIPTGFTLRPLGGIEEAEAYVDLHRAVFQSESMTVGWRRRALQHPDYRPDLDLVVVDPEGQFAAFCIGWFTKSGIAGQPTGQIEPFGVRADLRRGGLGRALLAECLWRLAGYGASQIAVETDNYRDAAYRFYEAIGFRRAHDILVYRKDYAHTRDYTS
jgi:mycothiol synthase